MFNLYLTDIEGYTQAIHRFETLYQEQADKMSIFLKKLEISLDGIREK